MLQCVKLSDSRGVIAAAAMDQGGSLLKIHRPGEGRRFEQITDDIVQHSSFRKAQVITPLKR
jgi:hypothetical protein